MIFSQVAKKVSKPDLPGKTIKRRILHFATESSDLDTLLVPDQMLAHIAGAGGQFEPLVVWLPSRNWSWPGTSPSLEAALD